MSTNAAIMDTAARYLGTKEVPGKASNPVIEQFFARAGHPGLTDDVPWCAGFVGSVLAEVGLIPSGSLMARSYATWGRAVARADAMPGDIVVLPRGAPPKGHVGFFVRWDGDGLILRGGNHNGGAEGDVVSDVRVRATDIVAIRRADALAPDGDVTLREGDRGLAVQMLQDRLAALRYFAGRQDGIFGPLTRGAVLAFQADHGLDTDGIVGPQTRAALRTAQPRPARDVGLPDLRAEGSRTVKAADRIEVVGAVGGATAAVTAVSDSVAQAEGALDVLSRVLADHWPLLAVIAAMALVVWYARQVRAARLADARDGAHVGR